MATKFANITQNVELRNRLIFAFAMIAIYRVGVFVPLPGVNRAARADLQEPVGVWVIVITRMPVPTNAVEVETLDQRHAEHVAVPVS